ncbi:FAU ubiquitin-like and ribosomal protein S30 [Oppia nitens]|uniref:FAU ubiquitin-like and ribosomal protein S30 n=1 Tax=Oppia nitens TaxID=1686743 RepID=UPI0023DC81A0|nr:FAU ubiquitin-like and ribosomal protein S30 [Oppia nitens]XP_054164035.1 FAU ubiquitin-like and ribosomal protein S30 [Oppia nitens]XP_054164036.1 FAU ubiquitin-like and ribosomal protein S30 [Oppia nitens]
MHLLLRSQSTHTYDVNPNEQIFDIKLFIERAENISNEDQVLYCCGRPLEEDQLISSANLKDGDSIDVCIRLRGGKVHGSLARAGKVKGQTPKVEKQEKKKKKTGRAKRRMQYNRRFVNVVATFGRRRGPNTNQT